MKTWVRPKWRVWIFLGVANALWMAACWFWIEREKWIWVTPIALSINVLLLTYDQFVKFRSLEGQPIAGHDPWGLLKIVHRLSEEMHVPEPNVFLIPTDSAQIFSYKKAKRARLFISEGALELLTPRQLQAALTFQITTMRYSYDILNYWVAAILDVGYRIGRGLERAFAFVFGWAPPLAAWFIRPWMWFSRLALLGRRDFLRIDHETARQLDKPEDLAQVLWKLDAYAQTKPWPDPWIFAHMCMVSPLKRQVGGGRVQPPLKSRIKELVGRYPL